MLCYRLHTSLLKQNHNSLTLGTQSYSAYPPLSKLTTSILKISSSSPSTSHWRARSPQFLARASTTTYQINPIKFIYRLRNNFTSGGGLKNNKPRWLKSQIPEAALEESRPVNVNLDTKYETPLYDYMGRKKFVRIFFASAVINLFITMVAVDFTYTAWLNDVAADALGTMSYWSVIALCAAFPALGVALLGVLKWQCRKYVSSLTLLPGGKELKIQSYTMFGNRSSGFVIPLTEISEGFVPPTLTEHKDAHFKVKGLWGFFVIDMQGKIHNLPALKAVLKHDTDNVLKMKSK